MSIGSGDGDEVDVRAAAWAVRTSERSLTDDEQQQLDEWLGADIRHFGAYVRAQAIWSDVDRVAALDEHAKADPPLLPRRWRHYSLAASLAALLIAGGVTLDRSIGRVATDRSEIRELALPDGSVAVLNGDSVLQVRYGEAERRIVLRQGEVSFRVRHGDARPFRVAADDVVVQAIGTEFVVALDDDNVEVLVASGVVRLGGGESAGARRIIRSNEQFVEAESGARKAQLDPAEVERRLAWRRGMLVFNGQSLGRAVKEVNRYSDVPVMIDDPTLARAEFLGVFRIGDGRTFAAAAAQAFNGEVVEREDGLHLMRAGNAPSH